MSEDASEPLEGVAPESTAQGEVDDSEVRAALASSNPEVRRRGVAVCETLVAEGVDAVRPFLDDVASLAADDYAPVALGAIRILDRVAADDPAALDGRLSGLAEATDGDVADVRLTSATALGKLVVRRPDLLVPHVERLLEAVRVTELDREIPDFEVVDDPVSRQTLREHEEGERERRVSARRTLVNVVVAVAEEEAAATLDAVDAIDGLVALLDDVDPVVAGGAVDALGHLAAADPAAVEPTSDRLIDCLDHERPFVRARAVRALGRLGSDAAVPKLRTVAASDGDEDVREIAEETAEFLAG